MARAVRSFDGTAWHVADAPAHYTLSSVWGSPSGVLRVTGHAPLPPLAGIPGSEAVVLRRNADGSWAREGVFQQLRGSANLARISGASDTNIWASGVNQPAGSGISHAFAAHFDGVTWTAEAGVGVPSQAETLIINRIFTDVAVSTPDAPAGAWFASGTRDVTAVRFDGTTWSAPDPIASGLIGIDVRGAAMWAAGFNGKVVRWTPAGWVVSNPALPGP